jgi:MazG family protein
MNFPERIHDAPPPHRREEESPGGSVEPGGSQELLDEEPVEAGGSPEQPRGATAEPGGCPKRPQGATVEPGGCPERPQGEPRPGTGSSLSLEGIPEGVLDRALALVAFLRKHCPWDAAQTARSLIPYLLEETHEVVDAIRAEDPESLEGELGDLLLNLAFQVVVGEEARSFTRESVVARMEEKMRRRHPHLFGLGERENWEAIKARERQGTARVLDGLAKGLDPLLKAHRIQERVSGVGFDWSDAGGAWSKVAEELEEVRVALEGGDGDAVEEELGDLLFAVVNLTRLAGAHPDAVLDRANRKFHQRFDSLEDLARERGIDLQEATLEVMDGLWEELKKQRD